MERRLDKHMNKQNTQLNELMEKLEAQVSFLYSSFALMQGVRVGESKIWESELYQSAFLLRSLKFS